jgi:photosystem II stability/assembly factor-like uncharacterized protein
MPRPQLRVFMLAAFVLAFAPPPASRRDLRGVRFVAPEHDRERRDKTAPLAEILAAARSERARFGHLLPGAPKLSGVSWVNLGPTEGEWTLSNVTISVGSGRASAIRVDPRSPDVVYLATAGGGIWKTWSFTADPPVWHPITETLGTLSIGALDLDPQAPDTLYVGLGDFVDGNGGQVVKSPDGGQSYGDPVALTGMSPTTGRALSAISIRDLRVDPTSSQVVLVASDVGLYRSTDAGAHFAPVALPTATPQPVDSALWSLAYVGQSDGASHWVASGVYACAPNRAPPAAAIGLPPGGLCRNGNQGDLWRSQDGGATWRSARADGVLPNLPGDVGRMSLAAGDTGNPAGTVVFAMTETMDEGATGGANHTNGFLRSRDGGASFDVVPGTLRNPWRSQGGYDCRDLDIGHNQSWYNQAIVVDPTDANHVLVGGQVCAMRTLNALSDSATWENVSSPATLYGESGCLPPYVHPDWHALAVVPLAGGARVYAGNDGGIYRADNVFAAATGRPCDISWTERNHGLVSHQMYTLGSGDPADGNPDVVFAGLQDNGNLYRDPTAPTRFNVVAGGDGIGSGVRPAIYWLSSFGGSDYHVRSYCLPAESNCASFDSWRSNGLAVPADDAEADFIKFAPVVAEPGSSTLTHSKYNVWKADETAAWRNVSGQHCLDGTCTSGSFPYAISNVAAADSIPGLYGIVLEGGSFAVTGDGTADAPTWTHSSASLGMGAQTLGQASALAFPGQTPAGKHPGDVYVVASDAPTLASGASVPASVGRLFLTEDRGRSFRPISGQGGPSPLPNVPVYAVRFDPGDDSGQSLYVGCELGVYLSTDGGASWTRYGYGLPMVRVTDLFLAKNSTLLRAATFGRGLWEIYPTQTAPGGVRGDGDFDRNQHIDVFDLAALAARLGTNPATAQAPYYSWYCDLTGVSDAIDDDDLTALLARFGDHP